MKFSSEAASAELGGLATVCKMTTQNHVEFARACGMSKVGGEITAAVDPAGRVV